VKAATVIVGALAAVLLAAAPAAAQPPARIAKSELIDVHYGQWTDAARGGRVVPYKAYVPKGAGGPFPVVIHSHGLGGSREASTYILQAVADAGFVVVALQHAGSDSSLLRPGGGSAEEQLATAGRGAMTAQVAQARYGDVPFAIDQIARDPALKDKADLTRLGMSGHSYGALSTLVAAGQRVLGAPRGVSFAEPRIDAFIAYSPNKPRGDDPVAAFAAIKRPMLHLTGTEDQTPFDLERSPFERTAPYQAITGADQYLIIFKGGDHALFGGRRTVTGQLKPTDPPQMEAVKAETIRFWRAYLLGDRRAAEALCALPARLKSQGEAFVKAQRCGPPTPIKPLAGD
jgi:dienelactone hydrolase